jgi:hypothetical protein
VIIIHPPLVLSNFLGRTSLAFPLKLVGIKGDWERDRHRLTDGARDILLADRQPLPVSRTLSR